MLIKQILDTVNAIIAIIMAFRCSLSVTKIATMASRMIIKTIAGITNATQAISTDIAYLIEYAAVVTVLATIFGFIVL